MDEQNFFQEIQVKSREMSRSFPAKMKVHGFYDALADFMFPVCRGNERSLKNTELSWEQLKLLLKELLIPLSPHLKEPAEIIVEEYFDQLPSIYNLLQKDARFIYQYDPAAYSIEEIIMAYPGFQAILAYRLVHPLYKMEVPILPRLIGEYMHRLTGVDIHPGAEIGHSFFIDHGTGIVIGETAVIGNQVKIYQGVTLGALSVKKGHAGKKRHPTIENDVTIYSGTTILGGNTVIGHDSVIGGNVWLTESIQPFSVVYHKSEVKIRSKSGFNEPINFVI